MPTISELKRRQPKPPEPKWWEKKPTIPGEACTPAQRRLADEKESYTGVCRRLFEASAGGLSSLGLEVGDYCISPPIRATRLLASKRYNELTTPHRAADFRSETEWRLQLRPSSPPCQPTRQSLQTLQTLRRNYSSPTIPSEQRRMSQTWQS
eukprot:gb/GFBE01036248.1/.p1 GENE.gb/GFBE01036248.1/~~gb/GFBE01036248.1/.p1  ORF type:complete len:152 (+),score=22.16 gb/GFBE01036248.1/:1-456(+)